MTPIEEQFETEWTMLAADHDLTIEQAQACLDLFRRQYDQLHDQHDQLLDITSDKDKDHEGTPKIHQGHVRRLRQAL